MAFLVDLAQTTSLDHGDALELTDGTLVEIIAADETLLRITGPDLAAPCVACRQPSHALPDRGRSSADPARPGDRSHAGTSWCDGDDS